MLLDEAGLLPNLKKYKKKILIFCLAKLYKLMKSWEKAIMAHDKNCEVAELMNEFFKIFI